LHYNCYLSINKIGAYFSNAQLFESINSNLLVKPQILSDTSIFYADSVNWMKINGIYIANGGEEYLTIGNFYDNKHTDTLHLVKSNILPIGAIVHFYYYIDDVSLYEITEPHAIADTTICLGDSLLIGANDTAIACNWYPALGINDTSLSQPQSIAQAEYLVLC
jgi:hypothetical protein